MMLHYLRIAVTALSLTACVLLVALWVRSYWRVDGILRDGTEGVLGVWSWLGAVEVEFNSFEPFNKGDNSWYIVSEVITPNTQRVDTAYGFPYQKTWASYRLIVPYWLLVASSAIFALLLWIWWPNRFSLRTLLIAITLVAVGLGLVVVLS